MEISDEKHHKKTTKSCNFDLLISSVIKKNGIKKLQDVIKVRSECDPHSTMAPPASLLFSVNSTIRRKNFLFIQKVRKFKRNKTV